MKSYEELVAEVPDEEIAEAVANACQTEHLNEEGAQFPIGFLINASLMRIAGYTPENHLATLERVRDYIIDNSTHKNGSQDCLFIINSNYPVLVPDIQLMSIREPKPREERFEIDIPIKGSLIVSTYAVNQEAAKAKAKYCLQEYIFERGELHLEINGEVKILS